MVIISKKKEETDEITWLYCNNYAAFGFK